MSGSKELLVSTVFIRSIYSLEENSGSLSLEKSHKEYEKRYNLRSRPVKFDQGQTVFKRNVILSDKNKNLNAKLCPKFVKCLVRNVLSQNRYELENENGKFLGVYHAQDIRA
uniref:Uncharacterized protein n=1 Tax=Megaselia scalaris TaxID=36166 RepID=T1H118_MEGSC